MAEIVITPANADRFDDAEHAISAGDGHSCQCQWWTIPNVEFQKMSVDERGELLREELNTSAVPPALIAYVDGEPAGWIRVGPRTALARLLRTREIVSVTPLPLEDPDVWAVTCFVVRREHRGQGLNGQLLAAAIDFARKHGARAIEAYPTDTSVARKASNELYRGILSVFEAAGFREVARPKPFRAVVAMDLTR
jgi:GNAT superfamily N-acetyltransferase